MEKREDTVSSKHENSVCEDKAMKENDASTVKDLDFRSDELTNDVTSHSSEGHEDDCNSIKLTPPSPVKNDTIKQPESVDTIDLLFSKTMQEMNDQDVYESILFEQKYSPHAKKKLKKDKKKNNIELSDNEFHPQPITSGLRFEPNYNYSVDENYNESPFSLPKINLNSFKPVITSNSDSMLYKEIAENFDRIWEAAKKWKPPSKTKQTQVVGMVPTKLESPSMVVVQTRMKDNVRLMPVSDLRNIQESYSTPKKKVKQTSSSGRSGQTLSNVCSSCGINSTSQWRKINNNIHCNACYSKLRRWILKNNKNQNNQKDVEEYFRLYGMDINHYNE